VSWEATETWPGERGEGAPFRAAAEVVVARRDALGVVERLRLWWRSDPDHPFSVVARRVALTSRWLFVESRAGGRRRVRLDAVRGRRKEAGRLLYAIADGVDLVLADRGGDALERALDQATGSVGEWRTRPGLTFGCVGIFAFSLLFVSVSLVLQYHRGAMDRLARHLWTSESALGLYAGVGGALLVLLLVTFFPRRLVADSLGLTSVRGLFGWIRDTKPVERVAGVRMHGHISGGKSSGSLVYTVTVVFDGPPEEVQVHVGVGHMGPRAVRARASALEVAERLSKLYGVELQRTGEV